MYLDLGYSFISPDRRCRLGFDHSCERVRGGGVYLDVDENPHPNPIVIGVGQKIEIE